MKNYIKIFKNGSFVLKPDTMRFSEKEEPIPDLLQIYKAISPTDSRVDNSIYFNYNNLLIALESYSMPGYYLTQIESNLRFNLGSNITRDRFNNKTYKIGIDQCFLINKSTISMGTRDIPLFLTSPNYENQLITQSGNTFNLAKMKSAKTDLYLQSFVFEKSTIKDSDDQELYIIRTIPLQNPMYIANQNKIPKTYAYNPAIEAINNMSFILHIIPFTIQLQVFTLYNGSMKTMTGGIVGILENNITDATRYILEPAFNKFQSGGTNFNYNTDQFFIRNPKNNTYLSYDLNTSFLYDNNTHKPGSNGIFNFKSNNGYTSLYNTSGQVLILYQNNLIKFVRESTISSNENLFKININYLLDNTTPQ